MPTELSVKRLDPNALKVYLVLDPKVCALTPVEVAQEAIAGGVGVVQWRAKTTMSAADHRQAEAIRQVCADTGALFIVNDDVQLAVDLGADGAHVGQDDMAASAARALLGPVPILGQSVRSQAEAEALAPDLVDYAGVYPTFRTQTKQDVPDPLSIADFASICRALPVPVVGIGGITVRNAGQVITAGAHGVAVVSAICAAEDPHDAARDLRRAVDVAYLNR